MKKVTAFVFAVIFIALFSVSAFAAGTDDGSISVADAGGKKFFGTDTSEGYIKYVAADGSGEFFYDVNDDKKMDICDLVATANGQLDLDRSGGFDANDTAALRLMLIGAAD